MKLPDGIKRTLAGVIGIVTTFLLAKNVIDSDTAQLIGGLSALLLGVGVTHAIQKAKKK